MKHLKRNVCDGCRAWCHYNLATFEERDSVDPGVDMVDHPSDADCVTCLRTAAAFGEVAVHRLVEMRIAAGELR